MQKIIRMNLEGVNCYLIQKEQSFLLVDTGGHMFMDKKYSDRREKLVSLLEENGVNETNLKMIILTHGDGDHIYNARYLKEKFHSKIAMHSEDIFLVESKDVNNYKINLHYQSLFLNVIVWIMDSKIKKLMEKVSNEFESFQPDILLEKGQSLSDYGFEAVIYTCQGIHQVPSAYQMKKGI